MRTSRLRETTAPWKGKLPKGAYSDIADPGMGDEAVWTNINGTLTLRKANVMIQVTMPKAKLDQIKLARASSDPNHRGRRRIIATRAT